MVPLRRRMPDGFGHGSVEKWQAASVPPGVSRDLETQPRADAQPAKRSSRWTTMATGLARAATPSVFSPSPPWGSKRARVSGVKAGPLLCLTPHPNRLPSEGRRCGNRASSSHDAHDSQAIHQIAGVKMVGSAGNAPVRHFRLSFLTPDLQSGSRITSRKIKGPEASRASGPGHFNKEQTPLGDLSDPNPRFCSGCFGVWGHTSSEALGL